MGEMDGDRLVVLDGLVVMFSGLVDRRMGE